MKATFVFIQTDEPAEDDLPAGRYWQIDLTISGDKKQRQELSFGEYRSLDEAVGAIRKWCEQRRFEDPWVSVAAVSTSLGP